MDIYQKSLELHPNDKQAQETYLQTQYEKIMKNMKLYVVCKEMNAQFNSMTYVFEHIKYALVEITNTFIPEQEREYFSKYDITDLQWRKRFLDVLINLKYVPIILWFFFYTNYYNHSDLDVQRKNLLENFELINNFYPKTMYFKTIDDLFSACPLTCLLFSISYQNRNNRRILENYAQTLRTICPDLVYQRVQKQLTPVGKGKRKVLFFSEFLAFDSSVLRDRLGIITQLTSRFDLYYGSFHNVDDIKGNISKFLAKKLKDRYLCLPSNLTDARNFISNQAFDIIVFCEIGMNVKGTLLAHSRMAPVQITTWGHSETSGIPTIDYFISSQYFEVKEDVAQTHYSEELVLFKSLSTYYYPPSKLLLTNQNNFKTRKDLGLADDLHIYGCIQSIFKISSDFEDILANIIKNDPKGYLMMSYAKPVCQSQMNRMKNKFGEENFQRVIFYPALETEFYLNLIKLSDVILDPYPFGGCNTSYEAFDFNIPVVTLPTKFLNGRFTFGMYKKMGIIEMVADSPEKYVEIANRVVSDKIFSENIKEKIQKYKVLIFQEKESVDDWGNFLENVSVRKKN
jgi:predicted O-linked N-acetylglucosamine transferase (SPINDLY family)